VAILFACASLLFYSCDWLVERRQKRNLSTLIIRLPLPRPSFRTRFVTAFSVANLTMPARAMAVDQKWLCRIQIYSARASSSHTRIVSRPSRVTREETKRQTDHLLTCFRNVSSCLRILLDSLPGARFLILRKSLPCWNPCTAPLTKSLE
jgi:hypothetical protein